MSFSQWETELFAIATRFRFVYKLPGYNTLYLYWEKGFKPEHTFNMLVEDYDIRQNIGNEE